MKGEQTNTVSGILVVDKPIGMSSHQVVQEVRRGTGIRRVGHAGTLDPRASGVLVILIGPAVRLSEYVSANDKRYQAIIRLGNATDTYDSEGKFTRETSPVNITEEEFAAALEGFVGHIEQTPPPYSAVKVKGRKAYEMARKGEKVELKSRMIDVYHLELLEWAPPEAVVDVYCSSGTYIRSLANDLGEKLGCGAYLSGLRRTKSGHFSLRDAVPLRKLQEAFINGTWYKYLIPAAEALSNWPAVYLTGDEVAEVRHGHRIPANPDFELKPGQMVRGIDEAEELVAIMELKEETGEWQPRKVFMA